jgi:2-succinyl-5-enolpyruvyl-6-hydroxy-3-cyclohexene-1-carboxylate synthase
MILTDNINLFWASLIVEELVRNGINMFYISPGSRSAPLAIAVNKNKRASYKIVYDERSAGFQALGYAKYCGKPAVLICTSGSAVSHYYPALIEAENAFIPMIIISADRPTELQNTGSNQTINQNNIFNNHVKWYFNLECPNENISPKYILSTVDDMIAHSLQNNAGPVHLNMMFREPLSPEKQFISPEYLSTLNSWNVCNTLYTKYIYNSNQLFPDDILNIINKSNKIIIFIADLNNVNISELKSFINKINCPIFADIQSHVRGINSDNIINYYDLILNNKTLVKPDLVINIGNNIVSRKYLEFTNNVDIKTISIKSTNNKYDTYSNNSINYTCDINNFIREFPDRIKCNNKWLFYWVNLNNNIILIINKIKLNNNLNEYLITKYISDNIHNSIVYLSSSMPVRMFDMYSGKSDNIYFSNRGASGIDGVLSSAVGMMDGCKRDIYLIIGDIAFLHDIGALYSAINSEYNLKIILLNNNGGGIFSNLPIAKHGEFFEEMFATPHNIGFENIIKAHGINYYSANNINALNNGLNSLLNNNLVSVLEIFYDRNNNQEYISNLIRELSNKIE